LRLLPPFLACLLLFLVSLSLLSGCVQRETDIGIDAVNNSPLDSFVTVEMTADTAITWVPKISNGRGTSLQIGDAAGFNSFFVMRFNPAAALPESVRVDSMVIKLHRDRIWPESDAVDLRVRIREITERWTQDSLLAGSLADRNDFPPLDSLLFEANQTEFSYQVPESLWTRWVAHDSSTWGLLFEPISIGSLFEIYSGETVSDTLRAALEIHGEEWFEVDSVWTDSTLFARQSPEHDAYLAVNSAVCDSTRLCLSEGFAQRAALYFALDSVTSYFHRAAVHAELYLYSDTLYPANMLYSNVGLLFKDGTMLGKTWMEDADSAKGNLVATTSSAFNATNEFVKFDVSWIVSGWVANPVANTGFQILTSEENGHLTRQVFHSPLSEDLTKRPRLKLWLVEQ